MGINAQTNVLIWLLGCNHVWNPVCRLWIGLITFIWVNLSSSFFSFSSSTTGTSRGGITEGATFGSDSRCTLPSMLPNSYPKTSENSLSQHLFVNLGFSASQNNVSNVSSLIDKMFWVCTTGRFICWAVSRPMEKNCHHQWWSRSDSFPCS